jgi:hypothetical protein
VGCPITSSNWPDAATRPRSRATHRDSGASESVWDHQPVVKSISYARLAELLARANIQLVEVLPAEEYRAAHLPGAVNVPLKLLDADATAGLDRTQPVVVYCWDSL